MNAKNNFLVRLNLLEYSMIKLGDALRIAFLAYSNLEKMDINVDRWTLYHMLTNITNLKYKKSFFHFYNYAFHYLINGFASNVSANNYNYQTPRFVIQNEYIMGKTLVSIEFFSYLYFDIWEQIVNYAIYNLTEDPNNCSTHYLSIPFDEYCVFYNYKNFKTAEDITAKFLSDLSDFLSFNHIILLKDFEINEKNLDLRIPIKFKFIT